MITVAQLRRARQRDVAIEGMTFTVEMLTELKLYKVIGVDVDSFIGNAELVKACVVGWKNVRECDLVDAGTEDELPFNRELFEEWIEDRPALWEPIVETMFQMRKDRDATREANGKN